MVQPVCAVMETIQYAGYIERLWLSVKYEEVYVHSYESVRDANNHLARYFQLYNRERLHESLGYWTPHEVYPGDGRNCDGKTDLANPQNTARFCVFTIGRVYCVKILI